MLVITLSDLIAIVLGAISIIPLIILFVWVKIVDIKSKLEKKKGE